MRMGEPFKGGIPYDKSKCLRCSCRSCGALNFIVCVYPGFHIGLYPHSTLGYAGVSPLQGSLYSFICVYPGFHIGLCPHSTLGFAGVSPLQGSLYSFICVYPGFHIGLRPYSTLGYAGMPPLQGSLLDWLVRLGVCKWLVAFVRVLFDCIVCGIGGDWCGRAMSPNGAILFHSPGRKPWVKCVKIFIEPL